MADKKVLSVAVCAYNMEEYLGNCLESLITDNIDKIEILIMNDGSTDKTGEIAESFVSRYPESFVHVNKKNGGWGSNLNEAIKIATGKYFREVDADDWISTAVLKDVVNDLEKTDVDMYVNNHVYILSETEYKDNTPDWIQYSGQKVVLEEINKFYMPIWDAAFRTDLVRDNYVDLPEKTLYTDNLFVQHALPYMKTAYFSDKCLYNYRLGRDGQSVDVNSLFKHYKELLLVWQESVDFYVGLPDELKGSKHTIAKMDYTYRIFMDYLIKMYEKDRKNVRISMKSMDEKLKKIDFLYKEEGKAKRIKMLRMTDYRSADIVKKLMK